MTEQEKVAYLQKKIKEAKKWKTTGTIVILIGIVSIFLGIMLDSFSEFTIVAFCLAYGIYLFVRHTGQSNNLVKELEKMNRTIPNPPCLNCGKELPNKNYGFCPFCGASLKH